MQVLPEFVAPGPSATVDSNIVQFWRSSYECRGLGAYNEYAGNMGGIVIDEVATLWLRVTTDPP